MIELEFSVIEDAQGESSFLGDILDEFQSRHSVRVHIRPMNWGQGWSDLFEIAMNGKGADVSHIGSTWISSLVAMNSLRSFLPREQEMMGGAEAFSAPVWKSAILGDDPQVWAIPWMSYIYMVCYRDDLLREAGIINGKEAFGSIEKLGETVKKLPAIQVEFPWLMQQVPPPFTDLLHLAASWIWGAGGDLLNDKLDETRFTRPEAVRGLKAFFEAYRVIPPAAQKFQPDECIQLFAEGRAAALVINDRAIAHVLNNPALDPVIRANIRTAPLSQAPWYGGSNLVIWRHTKGYPDREKAALALVSYLTNKAVQIRAAQLTNAIPARLEAAADLFGPEHPFYETVNTTSRTGKYYPPAAIWRRIEFQLASAMNEILVEAQREPSIDLEPLILKHLQPLAQRLNLALGR
jgi:ABC-type glycerol-3-phosphate transport system substrate-binding protein